MNIRNRGKVRGEHNTYTRESGRMKVQILGRREKIKV